MKAYQWNPEPKEITILALAEKDARGELWGEERQKFEALLKEAPRELRRRVAEIQKYYCIGTD